MAGNKDFSLLTKLTLNTVGFDQGVEGAKQKTKDLAKGTESAANAIKSSFSSLGNLAGGLTSNLSGIQGAVMQGIGAFRQMIPAIGSVRTAIISTGLGIIVVAIGVAFAALTSYMSGTSEGANKLKLAFSYVSGAITAIMNRVQTLGSSLVKLFSGDFKGAAEDLKKAFAGGLIDEIKKSAEAQNEFEKQTQELSKKKRALGYEEADQKAHIAKLNEDARDFESFGAKTRLNFLHEAMGIEQRMGDEKVTLEQKEYNLIMAKHKLKTNLSKDDKDEELSAYQAFRAAEQEQSERMQSYFRLRKKLSKEVADETNLKAVNLNLKFDIEIDTGDFKPEALIEPLEDIESITGKSAKYWDDYTKALDSVTESQNKAAKTFRALHGEMSAGGAVSLQAADAMTKYAESGGKSLKEMAKAGANAARSLIQQQIAEGVSAAVKAALIGLPFPFNMAAAAVAGAGATVLFNNLIPAFATGTDNAPGGLSLVGEKGPELVNLNKGSQVFTNQQTRNLLGGNSGGQVEFVLKGADLYGSIQNHSKRTNKMA